MSSGELKDRYGTYTLSGDGCRKYEDGETIRGFVGEVCVWEGKVPDKGNQTYIVNNSRGKKVYSIVNGETKLFIDDKEVKLKNKGRNVYEAEDRGYSLTLGRDEDIIRNGEHKKFIIKKNEEQYTEEYYDDKGDLNYIVKYDNKWIYYEADGKTELSAKRMAELGLAMDGDRADVVYDKNDITEKSGDAPATGSGSVNDVEDDNKKDTILTSVGKEDTASSYAKRLVNAEASADFAVSGAEKALKEAQLKEGEINEEFKSKLSAGQKILKFISFGKLGKKPDGKAAVLLEKVQKDINDKKAELAEAKKARKEADAEKIAKKRFKDAEKARKDAEKEFKKVQKNGDGEKIAAAQQKLDKAIKDEKEAKSGLEEVKKIHKEEKENGEKIKKQKIEEAKRNEKELKAETKGKKKALDKAKKELKAAGKEQKKAQKELDKALDAEKAEKQKKLQEAQDLVEKKKEEVRKAQEAYDTAKHGEREAKIAREGTEKMSPQEIMKKDRKSTEDIINNIRESIKKDIESKTAPEIPLKNLNKSVDDKINTNKDKLDVKDNNLNWCIDAVPSNLQNKLKALGILENDEKWMNSRQLRERLNNIEITPEQKEKLMEYANNRTDRVKEFKYYKRTRKLLHDYDR